MFKTTQHKTNIQSIPAQTGLVKNIQNEINKFNGRPNNEIVRNQLKNKVDSVLDSAILIGRIADYVTECNIYNNSARAVSKGSISIDVLIKDTNTSAFSYLITEPTESKYSADLKSKTISFLKNKGWDKVTLNAPVDPIIWVSSVLEKSENKNKDFWINTTSSATTTAYDLVNDNPLYPRAAGTGITTVAGTGITTGTNTLYPALTNSSMEERIKSVELITKKIEAFLQEYPCAFDTPTKTEKEILSDNVKAFDDAMKLVE